MTVKAVIMELNKAMRELESINFSNHAGLPTYQKRVYDAYLILDTLKDNLKEKK